MQLTVSPSSDTFILSVDQRIRWLWNLKVFHRVEEYSTTFGVWCRAGLRGENYQVTRAFYMSRRPSKTSETRMQYTMCR